MAYSRRLTCVVAWCLHGWCLWRLAAIWSHCGMSFVCLPHHYATPWIGLSSSHPDLLWLLGCGVRQLLDLRLTGTYWYSTLLRSSLSLSLPQFSHFPQDQSDWTWQRVWFHFPSRACIMAKAVSFGFRPSCTFLFERSCDCETMKCFAQFKTSFCASIHLRSNCTPVQLTHRRFHSGFKRRRLAPCSLARCTSF